MSKNPKKEYPPCPRKISQSRLDTLWVAIPTCFLLSFIKGVGIIIAIVLLVFWIAIQVEETWIDWTVLCDKGMAHLEVDQDYLLKYGFIQEKIGTPVRKATNDEIVAWMRYNSDANAFRYDDKFHPIDEKHGYFDEKAGFWLTKEEKRDKDDFERRTNAERWEANTKFARLYKRMEVTYGSDFWYIYRTILRSEEAKKEYVKTMVNEPEGLHKDVKLKVILDRIRDNENPKPDEIPESRYEEIKAKCLQLLKYKRDSEFPRYTAKWKYPEF